MSGNNMTVKISAIKLLVLFIITGNTAFANDKPETKIISFGIYAHSPDNGKSWINPISDQAVKGTTASPVHLKSTRKIPAKYPLFFGFEYNVENLKDQTTDITTEVIHPKIKQADGSFTTQYQQTQKFLVLDGKITATTGYLLENENEIQAGEWIYRIKLNGKTITSQNFTVTRN